MRLMHFFQGFSAAEAQSAVDTAWRDTPEDLSIKATTDLGSLFEDLKREDVKVN